MSRGDLQEMEVKTQQSKTAVNSGAKAGEAMDSSGAGSYEDLGGPTPENYRSDDDSAKLKTPEGTLKQVRDVVNKGTKSADPMKGMSKEDVDYDNKHGHSDENMTADEKHISRLAGDLKYDEKHHGSAAKMVSLTVFSASAFWSVSFLSATTSSAL